MNPKKNREITYESGHERDAAYLLIADPDIEDIIEQPPAVTYVDADGVVRGHTFDFAVKRTNTEIDAIAVKTASDVERSGIVQTVSHIRAQSSAPWATRVHVRTGMHMSRAAADNARLIVDALRWKDADDVDAVRSYARRLVGSVSIKALTEATISGPPGMQAVLCLLAEGFLELSRPGLIEYSSEVHLRMTPTN